MVDDEGTGNLGRSCRDALPEMTRSDTQNAAQSVLARELERKRPVSLAEGLGKRGQLDCTDRDAAAVGETSSERVLDTFKELPIFLISRVPHCGTVQKSWND